MPRSFQANTTYCVLFSVAREPMSAAGGVMTGLDGVSDVAGLDAGAEVVREGVAEEGAAETGEVMVVGSAEASDDIVGEGEVSEDTVGKAEDADGAVEPGGELVAAFLAQPAGNMNKRIIITANMNIKPIEIAESG